MNMKLRFVNMKLRFVNMKLRFHNNQPQENRRKVKRPGTTIF